MGTPEFAVPSLDILVAHVLPVIAVVTAPDKPRGRGQEVLPSPVKQRAVHHRIPLLQPESLKDPTFAADLRRLAPDLIVVVAFRILPPEIFAIPPLGSFNLHASLLPRYRGAAPINWAIIRGETETGVTTFFLAEKVDTGAVIMQERTPIGVDEDAGSLHDRLAHMGADAVLRTVMLIETGTAPRMMQDGSLVCPAPKIFKEHCLIAWDKPAGEVRNHIRGLSPHPAAFARHGGKPLKIYRTAFADAARPLPPGRILVDGGRLYVGAGDRPLEILELQQEGRRRMTAAEFLRGYHLASGEHFA
jgi:methionyl-tRNA formyltransferase